MATKIRVKGEAGMSECLVEICGEYCASGCVVTRCGLRNGHSGEHAHVYVLEKDGRAKRIERTAGALSEFQKAGLREIERTRS